MAPVTIHRRKSKSTRRLTAALIVFAAALVAAPALAEARGRYRSGAACAPVRPHRGHYDRHDRSHVGVDFGVTIGGRDGHIRIGGRYDSGHGYHHRPHGRYITRCEQVIVRPGCYENVWVPPVYHTWVDHCGRVHRRLVQCGRYERVWRAPVYRTVERRVWVEY